MLNVSSRNVQILSMRARSVRRRVLFIALAVVVMAGLSAGCSDGIRDAASQTSERSASAMSCPERSSWTVDIVIVNFLDDNVFLHPFNVDCYDWSGVSEPMNVFGGKMLDPSYERSFRLEPRRNVSRNWNMNFATASGEDLGTARFSIPTGSSGVMINDLKNYRKAGWDSDGRRVPYADGIYLGCVITPLASTTRPATSFEDLRRLRDSNGWTFAIISFEGDFSLATCGVPAHHPGRAYPA